MMYSSFALLLLASLVTSVELVISPSCGTLYGRVGDLNSGLGSLGSYSTIVAFEVGYTDGGKQDGTTLDEAVQVDPLDPKAGGRMTNGPVWVEYLASYVNATIKDYAVTKSVVDDTHYPSVKSTLDERDFLYQGRAFVIASDMSTYWNTQTENLVISSTDKPGGDTTLYVIFHGMEDFFLADASDFPTTASNILYELIKLADSPLYVKNILVVDNYGRGNVTDEGEIYKQDLLDGLGSLTKIFTGVNVSFINFENFWTAALGSDPGYEAFGYQSSGTCTVNETTTVGQCSDLDTTFYYIPQYPSTVTHRLMADYVKAVFETCI
ncbi:carbohydrate esterase family 16 protein [Desarmillaria ectypa]|nr:carbohydrate esterase family 16 protein [Desarmillaria ectypa]